MPGALGVKDSNESPDALLAARIARRMAAEGMIAAADEPAVRDALAAGRPSKAEWRQWAEGDGAGTSDG